MSKFFNGDEVVAEFLDESEFAEKVEQEVMICIHCDGEGEYMRLQYKKKKLLQPNIDEYRLVPCIVCQGSGRIVKETKIQYKPFKSRWERL